MKVSKHHYAIELAERGNRVYFIEPPDLGAKGITVDRVEGYDSLYVVRYKPLYRGERFIPEFAYRWLIKAQVKRIVKFLGGPPDVLWSFYTYHFRNLDWFGAKVKILHMMDISGRSLLPPEVNSADLCFGVTDSLVKYLQPSGRPVYFINHGLSKRFIMNNGSGLLSDRPSMNSRQITVGYVGNLMMGALDRDTMIRVIHDHPEIRFVFWGQYKVGQDILDAYRSPESFRFVEDLQNAANVVLRGPVAPEELSKEIKEADCFWLCYKKDMNGIWEGSNSHKILEYLITGKPVITHKVETYEDYENILYMVKDIHNENYPLLFDRIVGDLDHYSSEDLGKKRIEMALANSYENHIKFIETKIAENGYYQ
jgi:glycosyltransferase involved in cell wall biosynthesis